METKRGYDYISDYTYANVKSQIKQYQSEAANARLVKAAKTSLSFRTRLGLSIARIGFAIAARPELLDSRELAAAAK